jgi:tripeptide aminopeptidase
MNSPVPCSPIPVTYQNRSMIREDRLVKLFLYLCKINSPSLREEKCAGYVRKYLGDMGLEVREDDAGARCGGDANNIIARLPGNKPGVPKIFLSAHMDTVEPTEGLVIEYRDGTYFSGGETILGADDKGGLAPAIEVVHAFKESGEPHGDIVLLISIAEEIGLKGAAALDLTELELDFGYVLDTGPPVGTFVTRTATHDNLTISIAGRPAHAGKEPERGLNAIQVAAEAIHGMRLGRIGPETTANLGIIKGGTGVNVVCPFVEIRAEARSTSVEELDAQTSHMIDRFEEAVTKWGAELSIDHVRHYRSYEIAENEPVVRYAVAASRSLGFEPGLRTTLGGSDANIYNAKGLPCIVVATGMDAIHTHEERISRKDLIDTARLVYEIVCQIAR